MMQDFTGKTVGRYEIIEKLGSGRHGVVYRASDPILKRAVAVKFIDAEKMDSAFSAHGFHGFERETLLVVQLAHPNILSVYDYGLFEGSPYLVMQYIAAGSLRNLLQAGSPIEYRRALRLAGEAARALEYAHRQNLTHRNLHPGNILLTGNDEVLLCDFSLKKIFLPVEGQDAENPYVPPMDSNRYTPQDDQYALGVVLYEMLTGQLPFASKNGRLDKCSWIPARKILPVLPQELDAVLGCSLAINPQDRYADMADMADDLERLYLEKPIHAHLPPPANITLSEDRIERKQEQPPEEHLVEVAPLEQLLIDPTVKVKRFSWWWIAVAVCGLLAVALFLYIQFFR